MAGYPSPNSIITTDIVLYSDDFAEFTGNGMLVRTELDMSTNTMVVRVYKQDAFGELIAERIIFSGKTKTGENS